MVYKQQSGYTKVLTAKIVKQDLATVVSGTGQIKPKTYVNVGATAMGRITHLYVKEGDHVKKGQLSPRSRMCSRRHRLPARGSDLRGARPTSRPILLRKKRPRPMWSTPRPTWSRKSLTGIALRASIKAGILAKQDYDAKKAAYDTDVASVAQAVARLNQAKAQTDSARGHLQTAGRHAARSNQNALELTKAVAPFDGIVTNQPVREGETVVEGIQNTEGSTFMTLADMSVITAEVKVDETDIVNIQIGQPADVTVDAIPGKVFKGHVTLVGDQALLRSTGVATSQSTTGTEEAKDFKVVVTLDYAIG